MNGYEAWNGWLVIANRDPMRVRVIGSHREGVVLVKVTGIKDPVAQRLDCIYEHESAAWLARMVNHQRLAKAEQEKAERCRRKAMQADAREIKARLTRGDT